MNEYWISQGFWLRSARAAIASIFIRLADRWFGLAAMKDPSWFCSVMSTVPMCSRVTGSFVSKLSIASSSHLKNNSNVNEKLQFVFFKKKKIPRFSPVFEFGAMSKISGELLNKREYHRLLQNASRTLSLCSNRTGEYARWFSLFANHHD